MNAANSFVTLEKNREGRAKQLRIGDITIDAVIEREGPWRQPQDFFPAYDDGVFGHHLQSAVSRRKFFASVADTDTLILPIHFPAPTVGLIKPLGAAFDYRFKRE